MEFITVIPQESLDTDGDPVPAGSPLTVSAFAVAPGNTSLQFNNSGEVDAADFTLYLALDAPIRDDDIVVVRGRTCRARIQQWRDPWPDTIPLEGMVVLCTSKTGAS